MLLFLSLLASQAEDLSLSETSYTGASILIGDSDVVFEETLNQDYETDPHAYSFFEGNTLYLGNSDDEGNSVDAIIEFFWFRSSIDRGSDFYVGVIKARSTPGKDCFLSDCHLWADEYQDWGEYPVISVEAFTDVSREQGAFRWDWSVPFENYGIDAYGQVSFSNQYGIGGNAEGSVMAHGEYQISEEGDIKAAGDVQVKGYIGTEYRVQTQYDVTLYEWDVYVSGRADLMAWDMYLNLGARDDQSAYHEYFLAIQVEEGEAFMLDELNIMGNFDMGWWNPIHKELGVSLQDIIISQPYYEPAMDTGDEEEPSDEPMDTGEPEDTAVPEPEEEIEESPQEEELALEEGVPVKSCSSSTTLPEWILLLAPLAFIRRKR